MTETAPNALVSVERQVETDLATGKTATRLFLKMYFEARDSGLLADIGDRRWRTLCCMATYMSESGLCFPSQARIAKDLGIHRQRANERIQELLRYRFNGRPVIAFERRRIKTTSGERWGSNMYRILSIAGLGIFGQEPVSENPDTSPESDDPDTGHRPVSGKPDTGSPDTNKSQGINQTHTGCVLNYSPERELIVRFHAARGAAEAEPTRRELEQACALMSRVGESRARYVVDYALSEARKTQFSMRHFGAVLSYEADALAAQRRSARASQAKRTRVVAQRTRNAESEYEAWRDTELDGRYEALTPEARDGIRREAAEEVRSARGAQCLGFETFVRLAIRRRMAAERALPTLEEWSAKHSQSPRHAAAR